MNEGGKNSDKATLTAGDSVWYSFTAPKGGRYSFNVATADNAYANLAYYTEKYESKDRCWQPRECSTAESKRDSTGQSDITECKMQRQIQLK